MVSWSQILIGLNSHPVAPKVFSHKENGRINNIPIAEKLVDLENAGTIQHLVEADFNIPRAVYGVAEIELFSGYATECVSLKFTKFVSGVV